MNKQTSMKIFASVAAVLLAASPAAAAPMIYDLGTLGGTYSAGYGVNGAGQVAGYSYLTGDSGQHAFRYDGTPGSGGVMRDLGTLGGTSSRGLAINHAGQVAGYSGSPDPTVNRPRHAFRYDGTPGSGGVMLDLGTLGGTESLGFGVNTAGQVAGYSSITGDGTSHAFRYDGTPGSGGIMRDLGTLGEIDSYGQAINDAGQVAGFSNITGGSAYHAFRYDGTPGSGGVMRDLGTLGGTESYGQAVNDAGQVAGYSHITGDSGQRAFRYDGTPGSGGVLRDLGTLGGTYSLAYGINGAGQVVGGSYITDDSAEDAFLYTGTPGAGGQMLDLDVWLDSNNPVEGAKWTLFEARGLSDTGWITGIGSYYDGVTGGTRAFLLDASTLVPEPVTFSALALAAVLSFLPRQRRRL